MSNEELIAEARKAQKAVYLATDKDVADDLSRIIGGLADRLAAVSDTTPSEPQCTCPSGDGSLRWPCPAQCLRVAERAHPGWAESRFDLTLVSWPCSTGAPSAPVDREKLLVEVARAIYDENRPGTINADQWEACWPESKKHYLPLAKAALAVSPASARDEKGLVSTVAQLEALPIGAVLVAKSGATFKKDLDDFYWLQADDTDERWRPDGVVNCFQMPARVVWLHVTEEER